MRVDAAHRDPRLVQEAVQRLVGQLDHLVDPCGGDPPNGLLQRDVGAHVGHRQVPAVSIMVKRCTPQVAAINSVWPTKPGSLSCVASLFIGIVTIPATWPANASLVAASTYSRAAEPDAASMSPGRWSADFSSPASTTCNGPGFHCLGSDERLDLDIETEQAGAVLQDRQIAVHHHRLGRERPFGCTSQHDLRADAGGIAHRDRHGIACSSSHHQIHQRIGCTEATGLAGDAQRATVEPQRHPG